MFRFIVQDGGIIKLGEGDLEVACMKEWIGLTAIRRRHLLLSAWKEAV
jgi:hypothetical protein